MKSLQFEPIKLFSKLITKNEIDDAEKKDSVHSTSFTNQSKKSTPNPLVQLLRPYLTWVIISFILIVFSNGLNLVLPRLVGNYIDRYGVSGDSLATREFVLLGVLTIGVLVLGVLQVITTVFLSEKIAKDLRESMIDKLSKSSYQFVNGKGSSEIITTFTSDITNVKNVASLGIVYLLTAIILLLGSSFLLVITNWYLALWALGMLPIVIGLFFVIFRKLGPMFRKSQENISRLNKVVDESIFGAGLVRVLNSQTWEEKKFNTANSVSRDLGLNIINLFSLLIPSINFVSNITTVLIIYIGGNQIIQNQLSLGEFTSFITYYNLLITPIFILGFTSQGFSRGLVSYSRVQEILQAPSEDIQGSFTSELRGDIDVVHVTYEINTRKVLKDISFSIKSGTRTAIVGPTGAGKSQLLSLLIGLNRPNSGEILIDGHSLESWDRNFLLKQMGLVFQDSIIFRGTLRDNIVFSNEVSEEDLQKALYASSLDEMVSELPLGLDTPVSERGTTLSGGQKQRVMLARSLAINPKILLVDDFTARVDSETERKIKQRILETYPTLTFISITQKVSEIEDFDSIIVIMEGEIVGVGNHESLLQSNDEYKQIAASQNVLPEI